MKIARQPVTSSQVAAIGYDPASKQLDVEFKPFQKKGETTPRPNVTYRYQNVTPELHTDIITAESIGREINQRIKKLPGSYPYRRLTPQEASQ